MPDDDEYDVEDVVSDHGKTLPDLQLSIPHASQTEDGSQTEEKNVAHKSLPRDLERPDNAHGAGDYGGDEASSTKQLSNGKAAAVCREGGKGGEDIGAAIAKGQKSDAGKTLAHAQDCRNGAKVDAEEVAGGDANGTEKEAEP